MENTKETKTAFATVMWGVAEDFGGKLSEHGLKMRFTALKDYSIDQIEAAGTWLLMNREEKFPAVPTTKEFIDAIAKVSGEASAKAKAEIEADKVFKKLREWGREAQPLFYDEITKYLLTHRWTFGQLANKTAKDLEWFRKDFVAAYQDLAKEDAAAGTLLPQAPGGENISAKRLNLLVKPKRIQE